MWYRTLELTSICDTGIHVQEYMRFILLGIRMNQVGDRSVGRPSNLRTRGSRTGIQAIPKFRIRRNYGCVEMTDVFIYDCNLCLS